MPYINLANSNLIIVTVLSVTILLKMNGLLLKTAHAQKERVEYQHHIAEGHDARPVCRAQQSCGSHRYGYNIVNERPE